MRWAAALSAILVLGGCQGWQSALDTHGPNADRLKALILLIVIICALVWTLVMIALIAAINRKAPPRPHPLTLSPARERRMAMIVGACVAATVLIIDGLTVASFYTTRGLTLAGADALTIKVRGLQWWWQIEYLDPSPDRRFATANEIHIPTGRNVRLQLEGGDVIHSFWVPSLAGKQDIIPGRLNELVLRADRAGIYRGQCAEFCGLQHAHMAMLVIAEEPDAFEAWAQGQRAHAANSANAEAARGRAVFMAKPCAACHTIRGTPAAGGTGPDLTHVGSRQQIAAGLYETTPGTLAAWVADPQTLKPGNNMPMVPLGADELRAVAAYLASLK